MADVITHYQLEKDSHVDVHKIFGNEYYIAIAEIDGRYPMIDKIAHDIGRDEYLVVLEGSIILTHNDKTRMLDKNDTVLIADGDYYCMIGKARCVVFVHDKPNGTTEIEPRNITP